MSKSRCSKSLGGGVSSFSLLLLGFSWFGENLLKTSVRNKNSRKQTAFTLAEVLITLGIIGVVAAMTLPTLIQSYKKQVVETKLAKFYSVMNNAIRMAEAEYGSQDTWTDYNINAEAGDDGDFKYDKGDKIDAGVQKYFAPYIKITSSEVITNLKARPHKVYYLSDGSAFGFGLQSNNEILFFPSNPKKCLLNYENTDGKCVFVFTFIPVYKNSMSGFKDTMGKGVQPDTYDWNGKEDSLMTDSIRGCKNGNGTYCTKLIQINGWKIPDDYPFNF